MSAPEVQWRDRRPAACYRGDCLHRQHDGIVNPRFAAMQAEEKANARVVRERRLLDDMFTGGQWWLVEKQRERLHAAEQAYAVAAAAAWPH